MLPHLVLGTSPFGTLTDFAQTTNALFQGKELPITEERALRFIPGYGLFYISGPIRRLRKAYDDEE